MRKKVFLAIFLALSAWTPVLAKSDIAFGWGDSGRHYAAAEKPAFEKAAFPYSAWPCCGAPRHFPG